MSNLNRSVVVIPSYSIEDLPTGLGHEVSSDFLNAWTIGWDPRLLVCLGTLPEWKRTDSGALELENALILCPEVCREKVDIPQRERLNLGKCAMIDSNRLSRPALFDEVVKAIRDSNPENENARVLENTVLLGEDFYALGYAVLQVQILAKKLRYSWNLDWIAFSEQVMNAAKASINGDADETERWIQASFDALSQERDRYCSQQIYLLDVVLLAKSTLSDAFVEQMETTHPFSVLATSEVLETMRREHPESWGRLRAGLEAGKVSLIGGLRHEPISSYRTYRALFEDLREGRESYQSLGVHPPKVFSMFAPGVSFLHADLLREFGYVGALLNAWSGGKLPELDSSKIQWQTNSDSTPLDCVLGHVMDMSDAESLMHWTNKLVKQLDYHHIPTVVMAHWPNQLADSAQDLLRVVKRSPALGTLDVLENYFQSTTHSYSSNTFTNTQFKIPIPESREARNQLRNNLIEQAQINVRASRVRALTELWKQVSPDKIPAEAIARAHAVQRAAENIALDASTVSALSTSRETEETVFQARVGVLELIAKALGLGNVNHDGANGYLILNPCSHPQRVFVRDLSGAIDPQSSKRVMGCVTHHGKSQLVVDLPPHGFVKLRATGIQSNAGRSDVAPLVRNHSVWQRMTGKRTEIADSDWTMANEYMEIQIDPKRGHLRSVYVPSKRGSRMSGMPTLVAGEFDSNRKWKEEDFLSSELVGLQIVENSSVRGCIEATTTTKLPSGKKVVLRTRYTLWKGARWLNVQFIVDEASDADFHVIWRTAWANESATIAAWQQGVKGKLPTPLQSRLELVEIDDVENKIFVAARHNPVHHRFESRYLVTSVPFQKKGTINFEMAVGMDWSRPYETAMDLLDTPWVVPVHFPAGESKEDGAWLAQSNLPNVRFEFDSSDGAMIATESDSYSRPEGVDTSSVEKMAADAVLWVHETQGKRGQTRLSFFKNVEEAWRIDAVGQESGRLDVEDGQILVHLRPSEQCRIALRWTPNP